MTDAGAASRAPLAEHSFGCISCGQEAGLVRLFDSPSAAEIIRESFTSLLTHRVEPEQFERVRAIILAGDIRALYEFNREVASFYCPSCGACYCGDHWVVWDVFDDDEGFLWHDSIQGRCPLGHQRMLED